MAPDGRADGRRAVRRADIVAIETATETVGVAVRAAGRACEAEFALTGRRRHVETLTPALEHLLAQVGLAPGDLGAVAVDVGPGLFTGLRVGVAAAKGLAQSLGIGVVGATSLDILDGGRRARPGTAGSSWPASTPAGGGVRRRARARRPGGAASRSPSRPGLFTPGDLAAVLGGSAARRPRRRRRRRSATPASSTRCPASTCGARPWPSRRRPALLSLALARLGAGEAPVEPASVVPLYMREADAKSNFARAARA